MKSVLAARLMDTTGTRPNWPTAPQDKGNCSQVFLGCSLVPLLLLGTRGFYNALDVRGPRL